MNRVKISVVISVYNVEKYLRRCLDSICNQTLREIEIIAVNDASPDHSADILAEYAEKDSRIKVINHEKNSGQGAARNTGMVAAVGEFIAFIDSDDWLEPEMYETMYRKAQEYNADMVVCGVDLAFGERKQPYLHFKAENCYSGVDLIPGLLVNMDDDWGNSQTPYVELGEWNKIFRRDLITVNKIEHLSTGRILGEDFMFILEFLCCSGNVVCIPEVFYNYFRNNNVSMTRNRNPEIILSSFDSMVLMRNLLKEKNLFGEHISRRFNGFLYRQIHFAIMGLYLLNRENMMKIYDRVTVPDLWNFSAFASNRNTAIYQVLAAIRDKDQTRFNCALLKLKWMRWKFQHVPLWVGSFKSHITSWIR